MSAPGAVLLIHGAFRGGWAWDRVVPLLHAAGLDVHAPSLPGCGERHAGAVALGLDDWVSDLERWVIESDRRELVVVGHSQGALVAAALAHRVPDRVRLLLHLDGAVTDPGERAFDLGGGTLQQPPAHDLWIPPPAVTESDEVDAELAAWMNERLTPAPVGPSLDVVPVVPAGVRQEFVFATRTPAGFPSSLSRRRREERGLPFALIDCGHDVPLVAPSLAAQVIADLALEGRSARSNVDVSES